MIREADHSSIAKNPCDGALDARTKKLIALAVAFAIQEPYCIDSYSSACSDAGVSPEEMAEAVNVAAVIRLSWWEVFYKITLLLMLVISIELGREGVLQLIH